MKRNVLLLLLVSVLLIGVMPPAMAAEEPIGERINVLFEDPATFNAGEPFHVIHGFADFPSASIPGRFGFTLDVDGVSPGKGSLLNIGAGLTDGVWIRLWVYNFPDGMPAGDVTFTGHWLAPCAYSVDNLGYPGPCATPNEMVEVFTVDHTVTFS